MTVRFKLINSVELDRKGRIQYWKTLPIVNTPLPNLCPPLASLTPVVMQWTDDFSRPDNLDWGANWTQYHLYETPQFCILYGAIVGGALLSEQNPCVGADTTQNTVTGLYNPIPLAVKDQIVTATCKGTSMFVANPMWDGTQVNITGSFAVCSRMNPNAPGNGFAAENAIPPNQSGIIHYSGVYIENWTFDGTFSSAAVQIYRQDIKGFQPIGSSVVSRMGNGDILKLTTANFLFNPTFEAVCLKLYINGVQKIAVNDFDTANANRHGRILTGAMGLGTNGQNNAVPYGGTGTPGAIYIPFGDFVAQQVGPNPV